MKHDAGSYDAQNSSNYDDEDWLEDESNWDREDLWEDEEEEEEEWDGEAEDDWESDSAQDADDWDDVSGLESRFRSALRPRRSDVRRDRGNPSGQDSV